MKIATIIGTRPEIIKMAPIIDELKKRHIESIIIHTGQHYDTELSDAFFRDLELPIPDYNIHVGSGSHGKQTALMMEGIEKILIDEKVDLILVQGDTNAVLAGSVVAGKLHIAVGHVEAGLRSYDLTMPEEINRMVADVCTKMYFVPTEESSINLLVENIDKSKIIETGNTIVDACFRHLKIAKKRPISEKSLADLDLDNMDNIITLTMHRAENVDYEDRLKNIVSALSKLKEANIIFPIHPRTVKMFKKFNLWDDFNEMSHIHLIKPVGYLDFLLLMSKSSLILTDSGGLQEEAITLNIPALTLRYNTERPETVDVGANYLVGANQEMIVSYVNKILNDENFASKMKEAKNPYGDGTAAIKTVDAIEEFYTKGLLEIKPPENIFSSFDRKMEKILEDITVIEFEKKYNANIQLVYNGVKMEFPRNDLNLNNKMISYEKYQ